LVAPVDLTVPVGPAGAEVVGDDVPELAVEALG
jgi:hypothetical protein